MAAQRGMPNPTLRTLEEALGVSLTGEGEGKAEAEGEGEAADAVAAEGAYYLEPVTITEPSEDDCEYEEIPDDNYSIPEGEEDLAKAIHLVQEQTTDTKILEQKTILPPKHAAQEAIEDFLCNFLIKMGMTRTLDCFQAEWYELIQKGVTERRTFGNVPDVYTQVMLLESENRNLKKDLKHFKQAADKAKEDLMKTQKQRDFHRMHHKRIVQEKDKLVNDLKGLKLHYASYEPTLRVLHEKHHALLKEKMLTSLERDRAVGKVSKFTENTVKNYELQFHDLKKISGLQATLKNIDVGHCIHIPILGVDQSYKKENRSEDSEKVFRETKEENENKIKMKNHKKASFYRNQERVYELNTPSSFCPSPCRHQQEWRGSSQTWNKTTPLLRTFGKTQQSAGALGIRPPRTSCFSQLDPTGRF